MTVCFLLTLVWIHLLLIKTITQTQESTIMEYVQGFMNPLVNRSCSIFTMSSELNYMQNFVFLNCNYFEKQFEGFALFFPWKIYQNNVDIIAGASVSPQCFVVIHVTFIKISCKFNNDFFVQLSLGLRWGSPYFNEYSREGNKPHLEKIVLLEDF